MLEIYRHVFSRGALLAAKNWPVLGSLFAYSLLLALAGMFGSRLGFAGGILISVVTAACLGSFLYLVEMMVRSSRVSWEDFARSFSPYLWDIVGVNFILWVFWQIATPLLLQIPQGTLIALCLNLTILVFFNAVPELIYLGHHSLLSLLAESYRFVSENWIEWFPPNLFFGVCLLSLWQLPASNAVTLVLQAGAIALFVYFAMVVRGLLFIELSGSTRRGRAFRHKMDS